MTVLSPKHSHVSRAHPPVASPSLPPAPAPSPVEGGNFPQAPVPTAGSRGLMGGRGVVGVVVFLGSLVGLGFVM